MDDKMFELNIFGESKEEESEKRYHISVPWANGVPMGPIPPDYMPKSFIERMKKENGNINDEMFELNIFKEFAEESDAERIARQKREVLARIPKGKKIPFKFSLKGIPFGPNGVSIIESMIVRRDGKRNLTANNVTESSNFVEKPRPCIVELKKDSYFDENAEDEPLDSNLILKESITPSDIVVIVEKFREEYNMKVRIVKRNSNLYERMKTMDVAFHTIECNAENMYQLQNYDDIFKLNLTTETDEYLVLVAPNLVSPTLDNEESIRHLLLHEYGHTKTMSRIKMGEWVEYFFKNGILKDVEKLNGKINYNEYRYLSSIRHCVYYNLYPEYLANKYVNLDFRILLKELNHSYPPSDWRHSSLARIINTAIPIHILPILKKGIVDGVDLDYDDSAAYNIFMVDIYNSIFSNEAASVLINYL